MTTKAHVADMIDDRPPVQLRSRSQHQGPDGEAEDVHRNDKVGQQVLVAVELGHELRDPGGGGRTWKRRAA